MSERPRSRFRNAAGTWLEGPGLSGGSERGVRLGLPAQGPGSVAPFGRRLVGFLIDAFIANLLAGLPYLFGVHYAAGDRGTVVYVAFLLQEFVLVATAGATIGHRLVGVRVISVATGGPIGWGWALLRSVLLGLLIPAVIWDADGRGLHDKAAGAVVIHEPSAQPEPSRQPARPAAAAPARKRQRKRRR